MDGVVLIEDALCYFLLETVTSELGPCYQCTLHFSLINLLKLEHKEMMSSISSPITALTTP